MGSPTIGIDDTARKTKESIMDYPDDNLLTPENNKEKCKEHKEDDSDQSESEEESEPDYENQFQLIYPSYRNNEVEYEKYFQHSQKCYEQFTGANSLKAKQAREAREARELKEKNMKMMASPVKPQR